MMRVMMCVRVYVCKDDGDKIDRLDVRDEKMRILGFEVAEAIILDIRSINNCLITIK